MTYDDDRYEIRHGVDVSHHQGEIDWNKVKNAGFDFAFLRIGFRGYGEEGTLNPDKQFNANYSGAKNAGLDVGIYFFAQAVNEKEAVEEADYVLELLGGRKLDLPIVYDPESILDDVRPFGDLAQGKLVARRNILRQGDPQAGFPLFQGFQGDADVVFLIDADKSRHPVHLRFTAVRADVFSLYQL